MAHVIQMLEIGCVQGFKIPAFKITNTILSHLLFKGIETEILHYMIFWTFVLVCKLRFISVSHWIISCCPFMWTLGKEREILISTILTSIFLASPHPLITSGWHRKMEQGPTYGLDWSVTGSTASLCWECIHEIWKNLPHTIK